MALIPGNLYSENVQEGISDWVAETNCSVTVNDAGQSYFGGTAVKMTSTGAGDSHCNTGAAAAVAASTSYTHTVRGYTTGTGRTLNHFIDYYTGAFGYISSGGPGSQPTTGANWNAVAKTTDTTPGTAAFILNLPQTIGNSAGQVHWFDWMCARTDSTTPSNATDHTATITDALGLTDAASRVVDAARAIIDAAGLTDTVERSATYDREVLDAVSMDDGEATISVSLGADAEADEELGLLDSVAVGLDRPVTDVVGMVDSITAEIEVRLRPPFRGVLTHRNRTRGVLTHTNRTRGVLG